VHDQLASRGFDVFLPKHLAWTGRAPRRRRLEQPLFAGYLFVRDPIDKARYIAITSTRGVARILGDGWDRLAAVPHAEVDAVRRLTAGDAQVYRHRLLHDGDRVRIVGGPLTGLEGLLVRAHHARSLFVVSVGLLQRAVAVEVDAALVEPA